MKKGVIVPPSTSFLPRKPFKRLLSERCDCQISSDAVIQLRHFIETLATEISAQTKAEFDKCNERRVAQGLPKLRRINEYAVEKAIERFLAGKNDDDSGLQSERVGSRGGER